MYGVFIYRYNINLFNLNTDVHKPFEGNLVRCTHIHVEL